MSKDVKQRICGYTTAYIHDCEIKLKSNKLKSKRLAETILFDLLKDCRLRQSREFFKYPSCFLEMMRVGHSTF